MSATKPLKFEKANLLYIIHSNKVLNTYVKENKIIEIFKYIKQAIKDKTITTTLKPKSLSLQLIQKLVNLRVNLEDNKLIDQHGIHHFHSQDQALETIKQMHEVLINGHHTTTSLLFTKLKKECSCPNLYTLINSVMRKCEDEECIRRRKIEKVDHVQNELVKDNNLQVAENIMSESEASQLKEELKNAKKQMEDKDIIINQLKENNDKLNNALISSNKNNSLLQDNINKIVANNQDQNNQYKINNMVITNLLRNTDFPTAIREIEKEYVLFTGDLCYECISCVSKIRRKLLLLISPDKNALNKLASTLAAQRMNKHFEVVNQRNKECTIITKNPYNWISQQ
ncbi:hypothetical protein PPL_03501 (plasmid) [Heterostelium pallidum]|uniref:Uncharacterized protein n=1 Tax=Heterostelium pallidum (strain ATCC 26659 / Pp 5 / PN500) TaxID=670386 RepID=D3EMQ9_HETP5|nr:hypothetical protein PPL_03501 [Heterostelium pallidum]ADC31708.1 hypothetical protein PPL_03501 [Heterostelium pallidum]|eukprot:YP_003422572.1 hypothetical protein PPL_03501 (plasmid) [Heterostelium pallidum]